MIRLHQTFGAHTGRTLSFDAGPIRCGRQPVCEVAFDPNADLDASGHHAEISQVGVGWLLKDTGSRNGTWVNGTRVTEATLADGDEIEFGAGGPRVKVELLDPDAPTMRPPSGHASIRPPPVSERAIVFKPEPSAALPAPVAAPAPPPPAQPANPAAQKMPPTVQHPSVPASPARSGPAPAFAAPSEPKRRTGWWVAVALGCLGLVALGLAAGVGLWWFKRVRTPPPTAEDAARIATAHAGSLFTVFHRDSNGREHEVCAGFAVRRDVVATSARCIHALQAAAESGHHAFVRPPGGVDQGVTHMYRHPGMPAGAAEGPDVGLLRVNGSTPALTTLAPVEAVAGLPDGTAIFVWAAAETGGGLRGGRIVHVEELGGESAQHAGHVGGQQLQHTLAGTPGSPVLDREGRVIGVHAGTVAQGPVAGYGVRVDVLHGLLAGL